MTEKKLITDDPIEEDIATGERVVEDEVIEEADGDTIDDEDLGEGADA